MFGTENYGAFIVSGIILNITPGADTMYILGKSMAQGRKAGVLSVLGISSGSIVHTVLAAFGLSIVLQRSLIVFTLVKYLGVAYLVFLGFKTLLSKPTRSLAGDSKKESYFSIYRQGLLTNILNPKVALFFLAFLPQFISIDNSYGALPFIILGLTFVCTGTIWCLGLALFSSFASSKLRDNEKLSKGMNKVAGVTFVGLGLNLLRTKAAQ